ncbi:MAG: type II toxin-antitoxin system RelE/ParE family toxin [Alphaproteobacteria bacterium]|nr:type II toxin-antitoxin system RelE/ParE family toxin [Alphaproteobacteria bacterium]MBU0830795.1 type II toxin-antitoxin system RelE/ParE family toxin [Alphaproteobacteria bacterium]MBU1765196.1 type II toxin-antitoxin system RelE/ParE family toxin [Alphaproteobacteria bacterium]
MKYRLRLTREARQDIDALARYIAERADETVAIAYVDRLQAFLGRLSTFSERGTVRAETRPGLRIIGFERRLSIAFVVKGDEVRMLRVLAGGRRLILPEIN